MHSSRIIEKVKRDYDDIAEEFSTSRSLPWAEFKIFEKYLSANLDILDLGCGNGRLVYFLDKVGYRSYLGIDFSRNLISAARIKFPKNKFLVGDIRHPPVRKKKFGAIFLIASFHHIPPTEQLLALKKINELLMPGGYLFMLNWNLHQFRYLPSLLSSFIFPKYGFRGVLINWKNKLDRYYFAFTKSRLDRILQKSGLKVLENEYYYGDTKKNLLRARNILTVAKNV